MKDSLVDQARAVKIDKLTARDKAAAARAILVVRSDITVALGVAGYTARTRSGSFLRGYETACQIIADVFEDWQDTPQIDRALTPIRDKAPVRVGYIDTAGVRREAATGAA